MEENKEEKMEKSEKKCTCKSDLRTFVIALLTAVIVVSLYHFARGYYQLRRQAVRHAHAKQMVFVPCCCGQPDGAPGRFMGPHRRGGERRMMPGPDGRRMRPPMRDGKFHGKPMPGKQGKPMPGKAAPEKPAPAPAPAAAPAPAPAK